MVGTMILNVQSGPVVNRPWTKWHPRLMVEHDTEGIICTSTGTKLIGQCSLYRTYCTCMNMIFTKDLRYEKLLLRDS